MSWKTRKRGTLRQVGTKFKVSDKKKLPPRIALGEMSKRLRDGIARRMTGKPAKVLDYKPPNKVVAGAIKISFDNGVIENEVELKPHEKWVGTWDRLQDKVYLHERIPDKNRSSLAVHESVEKYLKENYGLDDNAEGHEAAEEIERKFHLSSGKTLRDWSEYSKLVERIHRAEVERENKLGGKVTSPPHEIEPSRKAHFRISQRSINWKKMQAEHYGKKARIVQMSPEDYLKRVPSLIGAKTSALTQLRRTGEKYFVKSSIDFLQNQIEKGEEIGIPWLDYSHEFRGWPEHEGRHRAYVAKKMGIKKIPVMVIE